MKRRDFIKRNSLIYKIKFWFYRLTIKDIKKYFNICFNFINEFILILIIFLSIFIVPAFFH